LTRGAALVHFVESMFSVKRESSNAVGHAQSIEETVIFQSELPLAQSTGSGMRRRYHILDVFTSVPLAGNPLAVVLDSAGLDTVAMQKIAREFNLSETVFVSDPADPVNFARLRIFTPTTELPFAGHPTVGAAVLLAKLQAPELLAAQDVGLTLEEGVGPVSCSVRHRRGEAAHASFDTPLLPEPAGDAPAFAELASLQKAKRRSGRAALAPS